MGEDDLDIDTVESGEGDDENKRSIHTLRGIHARDEDEDDMRATKLLREQRQRDREDLENTFERWCGVADPDSDEDEDEDE